jgi:hypothetical protein
LAIELVGYQGQGFLDNLIYVTGKHMFFVHDMAVIAESANEPGATPGAVVYHFEVVEEFIGGEVVVCNPAQEVVASGGDDADGVGQFVGDAGC